MIQHDLFSAEAELPHGLLYCPAFITAEEEAALIAEIGNLGFRQARYQQYTAKRRVVRFGSEVVKQALVPSQGKDEESDFPRVEFPPFLLDLRKRISEWTKIPELRFEHGLVTEYAPGTPIGW